MPIEFVVKGSKRTVAFAVCRNGVQEAKVFFADLSDAEQTKFRALFQWMADAGEIQNKRKFRHEGREIWAFKHAHKRRQIRFPCFIVETCWFLTHGFFKEGDKWRTQELDRAVRI